MTTQTTAQCEKIQTTVYSHKSMLTDSTHIEYVVRSSLCDFVQSQFMLIYTVAYFKVTFDVTSSLELNKCSLAHTWT